MQTALTASRAPRVKPCGYAPRFLGDNVLGIVSCAAYTACQH
jgi:hypothetical protein